MLNSILSNFYNFLFKTTNLSKRFLHLQKDCVSVFNHSTKLLPSYYSTNEKIWLEGLLVDWLQKSIFDKWVTRFLIHSSYLFSERVMFDFVVRFYIDYIIWPTHKFSIFDFRSVSNLLAFLLVFIMLLFLTFNLFHLTWVLC